MRKATRRVPNPSIESASLARFAFQLQCERLGKGTTSAADLRCILCHMVDRWRNCLFPGHISTYFTMYKRLDQKEHFAMEWNVQLRF